MIPILPHFFLMISSSFFYLPFLNVSNSVYFYFSLSQPLHKKFKKMIKPINSLDFIKQKSEMCDKCYIYFNILTLPLFQSHFKKWIFCL